METAREKERERDVGKNVNICVQNNKQTVAESDVAGKRPEKKPLKLFILRRIKKGRKKRQLKMNVEVKRKTAELHVYMY